jgi:aryl-alcohol dehydrogenase-like predicted oxidoreductase
MILHSLAAAPVQLGLGVLEIGRPWGFVPGVAPPEAEALELLECAFEQGIRYFDSAPSYGVGEERLGKFLRSLRPGERATVVVATKFGEHWDNAAGGPFVDHSFPALSASLERSLEILGKIDVLQLHKTSPEVLRSDGLAKAWALARSLGVSACGPSVSDTQSARIACESGQYEMMQAPVNAENPKFAGLIPQAEAAGMFIAANRPFAMGKAVYQEGAGPAESRVAAFRFVLERLTRGVVLTGTKSKEHLRQNVAAFAAARTPGDR